MCHFSWMTIRHFGNECKVAVNSAGTIFPLIEIVIPCKISGLPIQVLSLLLELLNQVHFLKKICICVFGFMGLNCRMWDLFLGCFLLKKIICFNWRIIALQYCDGFLPHLGMNWSQVCLCPLHPEPPSHHPPHSVPPDCHRALACSALLHISDSHQVQILLGF